MPRLGEGGSRRLCEPLRQEERRVLRRERAREVIALADLAAERLQRLGLLGRLDTLSHDIQAQTPG